MPDELLTRLRRFHDDTFPLQRDQFETLVTEGQSPSTLFIGCSDSRLVPYLLTGTGPGDLFMIRNVGAFVPPYDGITHRVAPTCAPATEGRDGRDGSEPPPAGHPVRLAGDEAGTSTAAGATSTPPQLHTHHGTAAAIEYAVLQLKVQRIIVCGHSHCGGIRALYDGAPPQARHLHAWLDLGRDAVLPVQPSPEALRRTEQRAVVLQLERLMDYPMVRDAVEARHLTLHGWHYVIEDGEVHVFDVATGQFLPASRAEHSGTGPYV